jgi:hypothetical protein
MGDIGLIGKIILKLIGGYEGADWIHLAQIKVQ